MCQTDGLSVIFRACHLFLFGLSSFGTSYDLDAETFQMAIKGPFVDFCRGADIAHRQMTRCMVHPQREIEFLHNFASGTTWPSCRTCCVAAASNRSSVRFGGNERVVFLFSSEIEPRFPDGVQGNAPIIEPFNQIGQFGMGVAQIDGLGHYQCIPATQRSEDSV